MAAQPPTYGSIFGRKKDGQDSSAPSEASVANEVDAPPSPAAGFVDASALLAKGVRVALTKDITGSSSSSAKKDSATQLGTLSLDGDSLKFAATKPKKSWTTFRVSSIHDVKHENDACRVSLTDDAPGDSFSFVSTDDAGNLSSLQVTALVARALKDVLVKAKPAENRPQTYAQLLEPLGLRESYCEAFRASGIPFQNLSVVTREDLAELVGVTNKVDQINIVTQIKRHRPDLGLPVFKVLPNEALLKEGVRVVLETHGGRRDRKSGKEMGTLVLDESRLKVDVTQPKKRLLTMPMSSIRDVEQDGNTCKVWLNEEGGNSSLSFVCSDPGGVTLSIKQALSGQPRAAGDTSSFAVLLGGIGLAEKYCAAFKTCRVPFENLGDMTRDDLAELLELVGVTDRLDQINIKAQMKRCFPVRPACSCNNERQSDDGIASGFKVVGNVMEGFGAFLGAFVG